MPEQEAKQIETVVIGRGSHTETGHRPDGPGSEYPACYTVRQTEKEWRKIDWEIVEPFYRLCKDCFPNKTSDTDA